MDDFGTMYATFGDVMDTNFVIGRLAARQARAA